MILTNKFISKLNQLNNSIHHRLDFHKQAGDVLVNMASEKEFWFEIFRLNLSENSSSFLSIILTLFSSSIFGKYPRNASKNVDFPAPFFPSTKVSFPF